MPDFPVDAESIARAKGEVYQLHAPLYVADPATAASLRNEPQIARTLAMFSRLTTVVMGLGPWDRRSPVAAVLTLGGSTRAMRRAL